MPARRFCRCGAVGFLYPAAMNDGCQTEPGPPAVADGPAPILLRAFVAAPLGEPARALLAAAQERLKRAGAAVGWVRPPAIHLTLLFLGDIAADAADGLGRALADLAARHAPFAVEIQGMGYFGSPRAPKVIWAGLTGYLQPLLVLQAAVADAVRAAGLRLDARPFKPHLTLGRVRSGRRAADLLGALAECRDRAFGPLEVGRLLLMKSQLTAQGPLYTVLRDCPLGAGS